MHSDDDEPYDVKSLRALFLNQQPHSLWHRRIGQKVATLPWPMWLCQLLLQLQTRHRLQVLISLITEWKRSTMWKQTLTVSLGFAPHPLYMQWRAENGGNGSRRMQMGSCSQSRSGVPIQIWRAPLTLIIPTIEKSYCQRKCTRSLARYQEQKSSGYRARDTSILRRRLRTRTPDLLKLLHGYIWNESLLVKMWD